MNKNDIKIFDTPEILANFFAEELLMFSKLPAEKITVALSGGSTPKTLFEILAKDYKTKIDWKKFHLYWGDERCVPPDDQESNFGMTKKYLLDLIEIPEKNIHRIQGEENPEREAMRYSAELSDNLEKKNDLPQFDIIILGMGEDGHTASIFPNQIGLLKSGKVCDVAIHPESGQKRVTITGKVINNAKHVYFLVTGKNKAGILADIYYKKGRYEKYPSAYIKPVNGKLSWLIDKAAAKFLDDVQ